MIITISESTRPDKKWMAKAEGHRTVHFGQRGASDYTLHHDEARRQAYIARHGRQGRLGQDGRHDARLALSPPPVGEAEPPCRHSRGLACCPSNPPPPPQPAP
jgi:hypothetical protein